MSGGEKIMEVDGQLYIDALTEQRNRAHTDAALAMARSVQFQRSAQAEKERADKAEAELAELKKAPAQET